MKEKNTKSRFNFAGAKKNEKAASKNLKIQKTFRIDSDVFLWLQQESIKTGIPYQTLLSVKLREVMNLPDRVEELVISALRKHKAS